MYSLKELLELKTHIEKLSEGVDPINDIKLRPNHFLNNEELKHSFNELLKIINSLLKQKEYDLINENVQTNCDLSIKGLMDLINETINDSTNKKYNRKMYSRKEMMQISCWLVNKGYLEEDIKKDAKKFYKTTDKSKEIGIYSIEKERVGGEKYSVIMYNNEAQKFIIENLNKILGQEIV